MGPAELGVTTEGADLLDWSGDGNKKDMQREHRHPAERLHSSLLLGTLELSALFVVAAAALGGGNVKPLARRLHKSARGIDCTSSFLHFSTSESSSHRKAEPAKASMAIGRKTEKLKPQPQAAGLRTVLHVGFVSVQASLSRRKAHQFIQTPTSEGTSRVHKSFCLLSSPTHL